MKTFLLALTLVLLTVFTAHAQTTIAVPAGGNLQSAINAAQCRDTILLEPGATYAGVFNLIAKPCTGPDYITITTSDPSGTPAALLNYPHSDTRITTAMAARMPKVVANHPLGYPAFWINKNARYWRIKGLNITNLPGLKVIRLIGMGEDDPKGRAEFPDHIDIEQNWIHPPEEVGEPLSAANIKRSAQNCIYLEGTNIRIRQNACQGFVGRDADGGTLTSAGHLMTTWADNVLVENNLIEAWTYAIFYGGGSKNIADPNAIATVSNCTATSCVFTNTAGLTVGKPVAVLVYTHIDSIGIFREVWGTAFVASVSGSTVNFAKPLCNSDNTGGNGNTCKPFDSNNLRQIPANGNQARWEGFQVQNVLVRRNILAHRPEWAAQMNNGCGGKGYLELKSCHNCTLDGNIFKGCTGPTITTRNQGGPDPWNDLDNLTISNNWFWNANSPLTAYLMDGGNLTERSRNARIINNLITGEYADPNEFNWFRVISNNFSGGENVRIEHNTILVGSSRNFISFAPNTMLALVIENNFIRVGPNQCFDYSTGEERGMPITTCWPNALVNKNVFVNVDGMSAADITHHWTQHYPNNSVTTLGAVGFVNAPPSLDASGNYRLRADSPFKGKASDGKDPGADIDALNAAIFGTSPPPPLPSPTPSISPTPQPSPSVPLPSPSPSPSVSPTPTPTPPPPQPTPTPTPTGMVKPHGRTLHGEATVEGVKVTLGGQETISRVGDGYFAFDIAVPFGSVITGSKDGWTFTPVTVKEGTPEQFYGLQGVPVSGPTPTPSPTPDPSPDPDPDPEPTPTPAPCTLDAPASISVPPNSDGKIAISLNSMTPQIDQFLVRATSSTPGQVSIISDNPLAVTGTSATIEFAVRVKRRSAIITFSSPCPTRQTVVMVQ